jgi:hypothetical protein
MTTIATPLGCSRCELNSEREQADTRENPEVVLQKNSCATPCAARSIDLVYCHGKSVTEIAGIVGIAEAGVRCHGGRYGRPYRAGRSMAEPIERD